MLFRSLVLILTSCSGNDDEVAASVVGKWEFIQTGFLVNGTEVLENYDHTEGCNKDYIEFKSNGTFDDVWYSNEGSGCSSENDPGTWTQNGQTMTTIYNDQDSSVGEILILNQTTLKVRFVDNSEGTAETYITVLTRQ